MLGAVLVDKRACKLGHEVKQRIKPSLVFGSGVVKKYLDKSGLQNQLGFHIVCYGCTTYIGNSRELDESVSAAIYENDIVTAAVLSGNWNFASPPLDVAYYLAGSVNIGCKKEPMGILKDGKKVYFWDVWPSTEEFAEHAVLEHLDECTSLFGISDGHGGY